MVKQITSARICRCRSSSIIEEFLPVNSTQNPIPGAIFKGIFELILAKGAYLLVFFKLTVMEQRLENSLLVNSPQCLDRTVLNKVFILFQTFPGPRITVGIPFFKKYGASV